MYIALLLTNKKKGVRRYNKKDDFRFHFNKKNVLVFIIVYDNSTLLSKNLINKYNNKKEMIETLKRN